MLCLLNVSFVGHSALPRLDGEETIKIRYAVLYLWGDDNLQKKAPNVATDATVAAFSVQCRTARE